MTDERIPPQAADAAEVADPNDDAAEIRYSLTALGEALVSERSRTRFRGFGPCSVASFKIAG